MSNANEVKPEEVKHLWEYDHPYYCEIGNFLKNGYHSEFESWADFAQEVSGHFIDLKGSILFDPAFDELNLLFRWDWRHYEDGKDPDVVEEYKDEYHSDMLKLFYIQQRKPYNSSAEIKVTVDDEPAVREWLAFRAKSMRNLWEPFLSFDESLKTYETAKPVVSLQ